MLSLIFILDKLDWWQMLFLITTFIQEIAVNVCPAGTRSKIQRNPKVERERENVKYLNHTPCVIMHCEPLLKKGVFITFKNTLHTL